MALRNPDSLAWANFVSGLSGWKDPGVVFSVGLLGVVAPFTGVDGVSHVAEEVKNPKTAIPKSMIWGTLINAIMAFGYAFTALYCTGDYEEALTGVTGYPVIQIAYQASGSNLAATYVLMALVILPSWVALCNSFASVNRLT